LNQLGKAPDPGKKKKRKRRESLTPTGEKEEKKKKASPFGERSYRIRSL